VVIFDDSEVVLDVTGRYLRGAGFRVVTALTLAEFERARPAEADLILVDVQMPELFGDDIGMVLRRVRRVKAPIFLFSTLPEAELAARAEEAGLDGYISKDAGLDAMLARVRAILGEP
jgi:DNA-binding response OmpR family regulator